MRTCLPVLLAAIAVATALFPAGCGGDDESAEPTPQPEPEPQEPGIEADIGPEGGQLVGGPDSGFEGFVLTIPEGALSSTVHVRFVGVVDNTSLPETAERVGPQIAFEPANTVLAKPAELTLPLDPGALGTLEGTPADCKAWGRTADGWEKIDAIRHGASTVTVPISVLTTIAAGINLQLPPPPCKTCASLGDPCTAESEGFCLTPLARPDPHSYLSDFASLTVAGRKVYWAGTEDGDGSKPTVYRYDLDNPGPTVAYNAYGGSCNSGTRVSRGRVAVVSQSEVWAGVQGCGNLRFRSNQTTQAFDAPPNAQPVGVVVQSGGTPQRFFRKVNGNDVEVKRASGTGTETKFVYKYDVHLPNTNRTELNPSDDLVGVASDNTFASVVSFHRGPGATFEPNPAVTAAGFWGVDFYVNPRNGVDRDSDTKTYGAGATMFTTLVSGGIWVAGARSEGNPVQLLGIGLSVDIDGVYSQETTSFPGTVRDIAALDHKTLIAVSYIRREVYILDMETRTIETLALPTTCAATDPNSCFYPWRIRTIDENQALIVMRGPLTQKGQFYLLERQ
jgi:hypothetical protein